MPTSLALPEYTLRHSNCVMMTSWGCCPYTCSPVLGLRAAVYLPPICTLRSANEASEREEASDYVSGRV